MNICCASGISLSKDSVWIEVNLAHSAIAEVSRSTINSVTRFVCLHHITLLYYW